MDKVIVKGIHRFTIITSSLIRIEEDRTEKFEDRATTVVQARSFSDPKFKIFEHRNGHELEIITDAIHMYYDGGDFSSESLYVDILLQGVSQVSRWYYGQKSDDYTNLKGTARTLDGADGEIPLGEGIMSRSGFYYLDDSDSFVYNRENDEYTLRDHQVIDGYLFAYGKNYQTELSDFYKLSGSTPLIPRSALGNWWSRYHAYSDQEYQALMTRFEKEQIPINISIIDMDWHRVDDVPEKYGSSWTGFSWNKKLFPDHRAFLDWLHRHGKKTALNLHPADGIRAYEDQYQAVANTMGLDTSAEEPATFDLENRKFRKAYFKDVLHPMEKDGVDFWWIDWQQGTGKTARHLDPLWLLNHYQYQDLLRNHPENALILSRYGGLGSHRYPIGFSGDTVISWKSLAFQPYFTITAANVGYTWWSHDIGGHMQGTFDGELATRWLQFGVFSPINRLHSSNNVFSGKEPWNYRLDYEQSQKVFLQLRTKFVPLLDSANYLTHEQGIPVVKPLYYEYPDRDEAYQFKNEYLFANEMLVSPITRPHDEVTQMAYSETWLPEGEWVDYFSHLIYQGNTVIKTYRSINQMPVFVRKGSIILTNPDYMKDLDHLPAKLEAEVFVGVNGKYQLFEHQVDKIAKTEFGWDEETQRLVSQSEDAHGILPSERKIELVKHSSSLRDVLAEMKRRLQVAHMAFDLKQKLYEAFKSPDYSYGSYINLLNTLENDNLRSSLSELAYVRLSYEQ